MAKASDILVVSAEVPQFKAAEIADWLAEQEIFASVWEDREGGPSRVEIFIPDDPTSPDWAAYGDAVSMTQADAEGRIAEACEALGISAKIEAAVVKAENWAESWKRFFKVVKISPHLVVRPPWEDYTPKAGERVLTLDPGMSFGTGKHATTQACMNLLDKLSLENPDRDVLDIGCGSGILSIAASKLGFKSVKGIDNDPDAVRIARENCEVNNVEAEFSTCDLAVSEEKGTVVVANVLAVVLKEFAVPVANSVRRMPGNALILSGILDEQYAEVKEAYEALGAVEINNVIIGEWRTGLFVFN